MKLNQPRPVHDPAPAGTHPEPGEAEIQKAAYHLWQGKGCPVGCDVDLWLEAKELLRHRAPSAAPATGHGPAARAAKSSSRAAAGAPAGVHFPPAHPIAPVQSAVLLSESAHLDCRHSSPPFQPGNPPLRNP